MSRAIRRWLLACTLPVAACEGGTGLPETGLLLEPGPHLLIDGHLLETVDGARRTVSVPTRDPTLPNPVVTGPEDGNFQPYLAVLREGGRFRMWYNVPFAEGVESRSRLGYLESLDGVRWHRPHRLLPDPEGGIRFGASVIRRPEGGYALGYHDSGGLKVATSDDGLSWRPIAPREVIQHTHDISGIAYDPIRGRYIAMVSQLVSRRSGGLAQISYRMPQQSVSTDLLRWETPWDMVVADARDAEATEFYGVDGFIARGGLLIAMVKVLRDDLDADGAPPSGEPRGMGYTTLAWSRDGRSWTRDRAAFFAPDPSPAAWDHAMAWIDEQVPVGDSVYLFYGGYRAGHKVERARDRQIGLVRIARDRYAGWEAGAHGGTLVTRPLRSSASAVTFNVDARNGELRVRVVDLAGADLLGACEPIRGDQLDAPLRCQVAISALRVPYRLELTLSGATVYGWSVVE